ncbi:MAG: hypothetical protein SynsKO_00330 [Synoicihabitans sp.]
MTAKTKAQIIWGVMIAAVAMGLLWQFYPLEDASRRLADLPERGIMMQSRDVPVSEAEASVFAGASVLKRLVKVRGQTVVLTVIDGTRNRHAVHDPAFCFRGAGWEVERETAFAVEWGEARRVALRRRAETAEALYWFSDGQRAFGSAVTYWGRTTLRRLSLGASGDEPILVVLTPVDDQPIDWDALLAAWPELGAL